MHGIVVSTACALSAIAGSGLPVAIGAGLSFLALIASARGAWTASGRWGPANTVTAIRLLVVLVLLAGAARWPVRVLGLGLAAAFALDALDGFVARRSGCASAFGAAFDMEVDAVLLLGAAYLLWWRVGMDAWVLIAGGLRYAYVVCLALVPPSGVDRKRSRLGRFAFLLSGLGLLAGLLLPAPANLIAAAAGTAVSCLSFGRSFREAYPGLVQWPRRLRDSGRRARGAARHTAGGAT
jgi:phosphatidylglycerophosphate synthase